MKKSPNTEEERPRRIRRNTDGFNDEDGSFLTYCSSYSTEEKFKKGTNQPRQLSSRSIDLIQNCDLPPPLKLFVGPEQPMINIVSDQEDEKLGLLKALQLSQTRAREAERKVKVLTEEREQLAKLYLQESFGLFAHRQWVKLLQIEVSKKKMKCQERVQQKLPSCDSCCCRITDEENMRDAGKEEQEGKDDDNEERNENCRLRWCMAFALCLGIAVSCRYLFKGFFFSFPFQRRPVLDTFVITKR